MSGRNWRVIFFKFYGFDIGNVELSEICTVSKFYSA